MIKDRISSKNAVIVIALILVAILSVSVISKYATSTEVHANSIKTLDDKKMKAMELTAGVAVTSTAITALPGDAATPIAEQVAQLTDPLLLVVCAIYLEKFLLTTIGYVSFKILLPIACLLGITYVFCQKEGLKTFAIKLGIFAVAISLVIPASVKITNLIEETFEVTITQTYDTAEEITGEAEKASEDKDSNAFMEFLQGIGNKVSNITESAKNALSVFIDAIAVLIITTCVIPLVVIFCFLWIVKMLFGITINVPSVKNSLKK